ncbi:glutamate-5-semialdehyde dehydrogenase [Denitrobaculum tricleocarpae]|uniref:Gamma-glutamyl phosphate reductase n=1 Tax=Denitrobaculum tricleocarpae TaxID=2591009 RepID=A0A545TQQ1_9PROT|nr:glutamate-5-semialdehyde dehydrogenase [Denitrobaculum tricleocarpae]TQV79553.1 glutamate-5-semialdehyde dehydrogenase [Denitrobaculum tricleocarpae]
MTAETAVLRDDLVSEMNDLGRAARAAAAELAMAGPEQRNDALQAAAEALRDQSDKIIAANAVDMSAAEAKGLSAAMLDRLLLDSDRVEAMALGLEAIADFPDPLGRVLEERSRPNGLQIAKIAVPLGVIGIIYESRPNVTADAGGLCLKSGNAAILRGGSESANSSGAILECLQAGLRKAGLPEAALQRLPTTDRAAVGIMLTMSEDIDLIVPRGGRGLIERVQQESRIPVMAHLDGLCHTYIHGDADKEMATEIAVNAKMRRTGICGATETLLVDRSAVESHLPDVLKALVSAGCEIRGDETVQAMEIGTSVKEAVAQDWDTEYLDSIISVKVVDGLDDAVSHINQHGSHHTEAIVTEDQTAAQAFLNRVDAAIVMHNASTQYADGGEFGMGAEIGISTGKLHARGPVGADQLTSYKYLVRGRGQVRP